MAPRPPDRAEARTALQERIQGILARTAHANPIAEDEARRLGERPEHLPDDPSLTHEQALANLTAGLPGAEVGVTYHRTDDGRWVDPRTGTVVDKV